MMWDPTAAIEASILSPPEPDEQAIPCPCYGRGMKVSDEDLQNLKLRAAVLAQATRRKEITDGFVEERCELTVQLRRASGAIPKVGFQKHAGIGRGRWLPQQADAWDRLEDRDHGHHTNIKTSSGALGNEKDRQQKTKLSGQLYSWDVHQVNEVPSADQCPPPTMPPVLSLKQKVANQSVKIKLNEVSRIKSTMFSINVARKKSAATSGCEMRETETVSSCPGVTKQSVVGYSPSNEAHGSRDFYQMKINQKMLELALFEPKS